MKPTIYIKKLIQRLTEHETAYDYNMGKEYWEFILSNGQKDEGSLYQTQIRSIRLAYLP